MNLPQINVFSLAGNGSGYNLGDDISGLSFSNVSPGGDEVCSFTLHRPWHARNPEIDKGNILRIMDGIDVLWQGRIEEAERQTSDDEAIDVTAYGLGARLKDELVQEIFIDRDLSKSGEPSTGRMKTILTNNFSGAGLNEYATSEIGRPSDEAATYGAGIIQKLGQVTISRTPVREAWFYGGGVDIGSLRFDARELTAFGADSRMQNQPYLINDDNAGAFTEGTNYKNTTTLNQTLTASEAGRKWALIQMIFNSSIATSNYTNAFAFLNIAVMGRHGLTEQGTWPKIGFTVSQMVGFIVEQKAGINLRELAATSYVVQQATFADPVSCEDAINSVNQYESDQRTWGTWGPDSALDNSTNGYFDYNEVDSDPSWLILREDCDSLDLHTETATLFNRVTVTYTTVAGQSKSVTREIYVEDLARAGITRTATLDAGESTEEDAQNLGDAYLGLTGNFAPARGSMSISAPIRHTARGRRAPHFMRADGSSVKMPDILPFQTLFTLDATPDRRTIFPIKRVSVDCGDRANPKVTVDVDQTADNLSALQARLGLFSSLLTQ